MSTVTITGQLHGQTVTIIADTNYGGTITSFIWNNIQFVQTGKNAAGANGQEIQTAIHSGISTDPMMSECYNPNEGGSETDTGYSSSTEIINMTANGNVLNTEVNMAFYAPPGGKTSACTKALNTTVLSGVILQKTVTLGFNQNIPQAIEYTITFQLPSNYLYNELNSVEIISWYFPNANDAKFDTFLQYNPVNGTHTDVTQAVKNNSNGVIQANYPVILSYANASYAGGLYSPQIEALYNYNYDQFYYTNTNSCNKLGIVFYINDLALNTPYTYTFYLVFGSLNDVISGLASLITAYPPPPPSLSYPESGYTFVINVAIPTINLTNLGSPVASYTISPTLPAGLSIDSTTGQIYGTPTALSPATNYTVTAVGSKGGPAHTNVNIAVVVAVPFTIVNNSNNSIEYNFNGINGTSANVAGTCRANSGTNPDIAVPTGTYTVVISPAGSPQNCDMMFNTGQFANNTPGATFTPVSVSNSATTSLTIRNP